MTVQSASDLSKAVYAGTLPVWVYCRNEAYADTKPFMQLSVRQAEGNKLYDPHMLLFDVKSK